MIDVNYINETPAILKKTTKKKKKKLLATQEALTVSYLGAVDYLFHIRRLFKPSNLNWPQNQ